MYAGEVIYQTPEEQQVTRELLKTITVPGDFAEVGVFNGGTALIMRELAPQREMYLFDTFEGFADELHESDPAHYKVGDCAAPIEVVERQFKGDKKAHIIKGVFPETSDIIKDKKFAFVHIDVDIYLPTKLSLEFFYPRMVKGGAILIHDYPAHSGVKLAVDQFLSDKTILTKTSPRQFVEGNVLLIQSAGSRQFIIYT